MTIDTSVNAAEGYFDEPISGTLTVEDVRQYVQQQVEDANVVHETVIPLPQHVIDHLEAEGIVLEGVVPIEKPEPFNRDLISARMAALTGVPVKAETMLALGFTPQGVLS